ncbi:MAG: site-specific integrase [Bryobacteraceae bacterium]
MAIHKRGKQWHLDVMIHGVRYREALDTTDRREALALEKKRVAEIQQGKGATKSGRDFARLPFADAAKLYQEERRPHVSARTVQFEGERLRPLLAFFGQKPLMRIRAEDVAAYQKSRLDQEISGRTINMETGVLRRMLKRGKVWNAISEDVQTFREHQAPIAKVLNAEQKRKLFETASSNAEWMVALCAAVLAVSTTCRGVELKNLRWRDVDLFNRTVAIRRSKTAAGQRTIPLNADACAAFSRLMERAGALGSSDQDHFVFPACEHQVDPLRHQKSFRTAWRKLTEKAGLKGFRFHDLRHQAITELAEAGASDATLMAISGHMSRRMLEHYSHVRMAAKREALDRLGGGLMDTSSPQSTSHEAKPEPQVRPSIH